MMRAVRLVALSGAFLMAAASPAAAEHQPKAQLSITVAVGENAPKSVTLTCDHDGGTHPTPRRACRLLRIAKGDPARLVRDHAVCTREFMPHRVTVKGVWHGETVDFTRTFGNACLMKAGGDAVYAI